MALVYCSEKLDGVASAAIITRHAQLRNKNIRFGGYLRHNTLQQQLKQMPKEPIFIAGICPNEKELDLIREKSITYWATHDPNAPKIASRIVDTTKEKKCSAELVQQRFLPNDSIAKKLAKLAHEITYWQKTEESQRLSDLIASGYNASEIVTSLSKGVIWSPRFESARNEYLKQKIEAYDKMLKTLTIKKYLRYSIGYVKASMKLTSADACQKVLDVHQGIDASIAVYKNGSVFFRKRNDCTLNMRQIAKFFDGGGREYAAGANIEEKNFENAINTLDKRLKEKLVDNSNV